MMSVQHQRSDGYEPMQSALCGKGFHLKWIPAKQKQMKTDPKDISVAITNSSDSHFEFIRAKELTSNSPQKYLMNKTKVLSTNLETTKMVYTFSYYKSKLAFSDQIYS